MAIQTKDDKLRRVFTLATGFAVSEELTLHLVIVQLGLLPIRRR